MGCNCGSCDIQRGVDTGITLRVSVMIKYIIGIGVVVIGIIAGVDFGPSVVIGVATGFTVHTLLSEYTQ